MLFCTLQQFNFVLVLLCINLLSTTSGAYYANLDDPKPSTNCTMIVKVLGHAAADFTSCTVDNSQPIRMCENCVDDFLLVQQAYRGLLEGSDVNGTCKPRWIDLDRMQLVQTAYEHVMDLWTKAHCYNCFDWKSGPEQLFNQTLSNNTVNFLVLSTKMHHCVEVNNNTDQPKRVCIQCATQYADLNELYEYMKTEDDDVCMDIVDTMNKTRNVWSRQLHCTERNLQPQTLFYVALVLTVLLPILFYGSVKLAGIKRHAE